MLVLVSLINPIRSFGEKSRFIRILLTNTHPQVVAFSQDGSVFPEEMSDREWKLFIRDPLAWVTSLAINTALNKPAVCVTLKYSTAALFSSK